MQLRQEANSELRKKFHLIAKLRKACGHSIQLDTLCNVSKLGFILKIIFVLPNLI